MFIASPESIAMTGFVNDALAYYALRSEMLAFGVQLARRGDRQLMEEFYAATGFTKEQLKKHPDADRFLTCL